MDGDATRIDGRHTRRSHHDGPLPRLLDDGLQERRLTRSRLARQEDAAARILHKVPRRAQFSILLHTNPFNP